MDDNHDQAKPRSEWDVEERIKHQQELAERREFWEKQRAAEAEQQRVSKLRQEMATYREERLTDWMEHGGDPADFNKAWPQMMKDYLDGKHFEQELEREGRFEDIFS